MSFLFAISFITSFSAHAAQDPYIGLKMEEKPRFEFTIKREGYKHTTDSSYLETYAGVLDADYDHTAPYRIEIEELVDGVSELKFTIHHQYQLQLHCGSSNVSQGSMIEYRYWTKSVPLYGEDRVFIPNDEEFLSRKKAPDATPFKALLPSEDKTVSCYFSVAQTRYTIELDGKIIKKIFLEPESGC